MTPSRDQSDNWAFCRDYLGRVSRTFSLPISMLSPTLERTVTCGYLLCRVADTIEDQVGFPLATRDRLYGSFLAVLDHRAPPSAFEREFLSSVVGSSDEAALALSLGRVLDVLDTSPPEAQLACRHWVAELARGMAIYSHRRPGPDGVVTLYSIADLDRYCYFVAGVVGHLLTELFLLDVGTISADRARRMRSGSEAFGAGLQLVNILKDISEDLARDVCFIPASLWSDQQLSPRDIFVPARRSAAHQALGAVIDRAWQLLDDAFAYTLAVPPERRDIRLFCLAPLWLGLATLGLVQGNDDVLRPECKVKIDRADVGALLSECQRLASDDTALQAAYRRLSEPRNDSIPRSLELAVVG